ncbi:hypothetical protein HY933_04525 [Candidatus Falkowbacteria bacterium]|nr:hypothetical protein [Candidatus Falkowbacteria bacterium]
MVGEQNQSGGFNSNDRKIHSIKFGTNHKTFFLNFKTSAKGRYLKISEQRFGQQTTSIVPAEGIEPLLRGVEEMKGKL